MARNFALSDLHGSARKQAEDLLIADTLREVAEKAEKPKRKHKYNAQPVEIDGIWFASKAEAKRWTELRLSERAGTITDLIRQPRLKIVINGISVCAVVPDFKYVHGGREIYEDVKSPATRTAVFRIKKILAQAVLGVQIVEVLR